VSLDAHWRSPTLVGQSDAPGYEQQRIALVTRSGARLPVLAAFSPRWRIVSVRMRQHGVGRPHRCHARGREARDFPFGVFTRELVIDAGGLQTTCVVDVREPEAVLAKLADARRRFEEGGGVPIAVHDLLVELDGAIAGSGPFELDVSPRRWVRIQTRMSGLVESLNDATAQESAARAQKALRQLRRLFKRGRRSRRLRAPFNDARWVPFTLLALYFVLLGGGIWLVGLVVSHRHSNLAAVMLSLMFVFFLIFFFVFIGVTKHATRGAGDRKLAAMHAPEERRLFASRPQSRELVVATDERVFAVSAPRRLSRSRPLWSVPYARITYVRPEKGANVRRVTLHAGAGTQWVEWRWSDVGSDDSDPHKDEQQALLMILGRRVASLPRTGSRRASALGFE
jgi:hypothetical protein